MTQFNDVNQLLAHFERRARRHNRLGVLLGLGQIGLTIGFAYLTAQLLGDLLIAPQPLEGVNLTLLALALILVLRAVAGFAQQRLAMRASILIRQALRRYALEHCFRANLELFPRFEVTQLAQLLTAEVDKLRGYFADFVAQKRLAVLTPIAVIVASATVNWLVPLILAVTAPLLVLFMILVGHRAAEASRANLTQLTRLGNQLTDRLKGLQALQLADAVEPEGARIFERSELFRQSTMKVLRMAFLSGTLLEFFSAISVALVAVYLGLFFLDKYQLGAWGGDLTLQDGVFLLMLAPEFYLPLRRLGALYHAKADATSVGEQLLGLIRKAETVAAPSHSAQPLARLTELSLEQVCAGAPDQPLHPPLSLTLNAGDRCLLRGVSGSGKTSLLDALTGMRPLNHGGVCLNGERFDPYQQPSWFAQIGYLPQHPELIQASLRDNLTLGATFSDAQLRAAIERAGIAALVDQLPGGLAYQITDQGGYLSGGQVQRLVMARVFLHQPRLLLLDEPTANLDHDNAQLFMAQLRGYCEQGGILLMASHRPADRRFFNIEVDLASGVVTEVSA